MCRLSSQRDTTRQTEPRPISNRCKETFNHDHAQYRGIRRRPPTAASIMKAMNVRNEGFSTIIIDMFHIGNAAIKAGTQLGDIIFNGDDPLVIRDGKYVPLPTGPDTSRN